MTIEADQSTAEEITEMMREMLTLQHRFNEDVTPNWQQNRAVDEYRLATLVEGVELLDSLPWTWWRETQTVIDNVKIEVIDVWRFLMSLLILVSGGKDAAIRPCEQVLYAINATDKQGLEPQILIARLHEFLGSLFRDDGYAQALREFSKLAGSLFTLQEFYFLYLGKDSLNHLRRKHGYARGSYRKEVDGREDNTYLLEIACQAETVDDLHTRLESFVVSNN